MNREGMKRGDMVRFWATHNGRSRRNRSYRYFAVTRYGQQIEARTVTELRRQISAVCRAYEAMKGA
jgi:hypothetical protein